MIPRLLTAALSSFILFQLQLIALAYLVIIEVKRILK